jgi:hypothetical protein
MIKGALFVEFIATQHIPLLTLVNVEGVIDLMESRIFLYTEMGIPRAVNAIIDRPFPNDRPLCGDLV